MGLFDKFRKKKKPSPAPPTGSQKTEMGPTITRAPYGKSIQIKGPPRSSMGTYNTNIQQNIHRTTLAQLSKPKTLNDPEIQKQIDDSVRRIPRVPRQKPVSRPVQTKVVRTKEIRTIPATTGPKTSPGTAKTVKSQLLEDAMGEEELFKKLAQWDHELKKKTTIKRMPVKVPKLPASPTQPSPPSAPAQPLKIAKEKRPKTITDIKKREERLRKLELKLEEREKKLKKKEQMNKLFTDIEDSELEGFTKDTVGETGLVQDEIKVKEDRLKQWEQEIIKREMELQKSIEGKSEFEPPEDLLQPLKNLTFTTFIVGPSNRFAHDVALSVAKAPADAYNPLFIYSEVGLGKTHLLCAIGNYVKSKNPEYRIVYASSEKFTNELLDYLRMGEMEKFRSKYRNVDILLIDDIQFIGGQEGTQEEFFHTFNSLYNAHKQIVITSDRPPKNISHLKDRLRSRFEGGLIINIKPPDLGTRTQILHEKAEKDGIYIPDEIINYIAGKVKSNVRTLIGVLNRVVAHSSLTDREMDTSLVDEVLADVMDEKLQLPSI